MYLPEEEHEVNIQGDEMCPGREVDKTDRGLDPRTHGVLCNRDIYMHMGYSVIFIDICT